MTTTHPFPLVEGLYATYDFPTTASKISWLPYGSTWTSSGNCLETETCMVGACHTPRQPLRDHRSRHLERWTTTWSAEEMHQRVDIHTHCRTALKGFLQKRLEEDLCWIVPHEPPTGSEISSLMGAQERLLATVRRRKSVKGLNYPTGVVGRSWSKTDRWYAPSTGDNRSTMIDWLNDCSVLRREKRLWSFTFLFPLRTIQCFQSCSRFSGKFVIG